MWGEKWHTQAILTSPPDGGKYQLRTPKCLTAGTQCAGHWVVPDPAWPFWSQRLLPLPGIILRHHRRPARSLTAIPTELQLSILQRGNNTIYVKVSLNCVHAWNVETKLVFSPLFETVPCIYIYTHTFNTSKSDMNDKEHRVSIPCALSSGYAFPVVATVTTCCALRTSSPPTPRARSLSLSVSPLQTFPFRINV